RAAGQNAGTSFALRRPVPRRSLPRLWGGQGGGWPHMPHAMVSQEQRRRAGQLRRTMTRAETLLWRYIKAHRVSGFRHDQLLANLEGVVETIRNTASSRLRSTPPSLSLPDKGGGNP